MRESEEERKAPLGDKKNSNNDLSESYQKNVQEIVGAYKTLNNGFEFHRES